MHRLFAPILFLFISTTMAFGKYQPNTNHNLLLINQDPPTVNQQQEYVDQARLISEIDRLVTSKDSKDLAGAAYLIGKYNLKEQVPYLYQILAKESLVTDRNFSYVQMAVLDSLIRLKAPLTTELATELYADFPAQTLILLAQHINDTQQTLFTLLQTASASALDIKWVAIGNLLVESRFNAFTAYLLNEVTIKARVSVQDSDNIVGGVEGGVVGGRIGDGWFGVPEGFPPITRYQLTEWPKYGSVMLATGKHAIYFDQRVVNAGEHIGVGGTSRDIDKDEYIIDYLAALLSIHASNVESAIKPHFSITIKNINQYPKKIEAIRKKIDLLYSSLVAKFVEKDLVMADQIASTKGRVELIIEDFRVNKKVPLPALKEVKEANREEQQ